MFGQTTPSRRKFYSNLFADESGDRPGDEHLRAQGGRLAIRLFRGDLALVEAEQFEGD